MNTIIVVILVCLFFYFLKRLCDYILNKLVNYYENENNRDNKKH